VIYGLKIPLLKHSNNLSLLHCFWLTATSFHVNVISRTLLVFFFFLSVLGTPASLPRCQDIVYNPASRTLTVLTRRGLNSQNERNLADGPRWVDIAD
jgi:hypothetical protein